MMQNRIVLQVFLKTFDYSVLWELQLVFEEFNKEYNFQIFNFKETNRNFYELNNILLLSF